MSDEEAALWTGDPLGGVDAAKAPKGSWWVDAVRLRGWDEKAKRVDHAAPPLDAWYELIRDHLEKQASLHA